MYSDYGLLGVNRQMLANLHEHQRMRQTASMTSDWLGVLPMSKSHLAGDWWSSIRDLQKWRPTPVVVETARCQSLNFNVVGDEIVDSSLYCRSRRRRRDSNDDGQRPTNPSTDEPCGATKRRATVVNRRRFDFTRLAESATRRDDSSPAASDTEITPSKGGVKIIRHDDDQSDRRQPAAADAAAVENADKRSLMWSLTHHSTTLQPLKSVVNPIESFDRYIPSAPFDDKITKTIRLRYTV